MSKDYSVPVLNGAGDSDYARYMRTDALLALQRRPEDVVHRDELLFQTVHQSTELWLKLGCFEVAEAAAEIRADALGAAERLLARGSLTVELVTDQLEMLRHMPPWNFQLVRTVLGHGSGFESPGWRNVQRTSEDIGKAFDALLASRQVELLALYRGSPDDPLYRLAEALVDWDERVALWRAQHYKVATRIIGHEVVGTKGTPVDVLTRLLRHKFFPDLWRVRTELTESGPLTATDARNGDGALIGASAPSGSGRVGADGAR